MDPIQKALEEAKAKAAEKAAADAAKVDKGIAGSGQAPAVIHPIAKHVAAAVSCYGKKHIPELLGIGEVPSEGRPSEHVHVSANLGVKNHAVSDEVRAVLLNIKKEVHNAFLQQQIMVKRTGMPIAVTDTPYFKAVVEPLCKAFDLSGFSSWVPTLNTSFYFEEFELEPGIERFFPSFPMGSRSVTVPGATARLKGKLEVDSATFTAQYNTAGSYTMTAQDCVTHTDITEDLMQDMVPQAGGFDRLRREVALGIRRSKEDAIINGDDTITSTVQGDGHQDSDIAGGAATLFQKAFKGLRKRAIAAGATYDNASAAMTLATYNGLLTKMGKFAIDKTDLLIVLGPTGSNRVVMGNVPELLTMYNVGPRATLVTGQLPTVYGVEQYTSEWVREDVNSSGVYAASQVLTTVIAVRKSRFVVGQRAPMKIWATPSLASSDKMLMSAKERFSFGGVPQSATETSVAIALAVALT